MSRFCSCVMADEFPVKLYVYDLSKGMARQLSLPLLGRQIDGIWHTAIVCYETEFFFGGGGIDNCGPGGTILGQPDSVVDLGKTQVTHEIFMDYLRELGSTSFRAETYNLFEHNCNNFSNEVAQFLVGRCIPSQITSLPRDVLSTPFGAMIKPFVDSMQVHPRGGQPGAGMQQGQSHSHNRSGSRSPKRERDRSSNSVSASPSAASAPSVTSFAPTTSPSYHPTSPPVLYKERPLPEQGTLVPALSSLLQEEETRLLGESLAYAARSDNDISLSRAHLKVLDKVLSSDGVEAATQGQVLSVLQRLVLHADFATMVCGDPDQTLVRLIHKSDSQPAVVRAGVVMMMVNLSGCAGGHAFLAGRGSGSNTASVRKLVKDVSISCLLQSEDRELVELAAALIHNLSLSQIDDDTVVELGSAVLEVLQRDISSKTGEYALTALSNFIKRSPEVKSLTEIMGLAWSNISSLSPVAETLCKQIQACYA